MKNNYTGVFANTLSFLLVEFKFYLKTILFVVLIVFIGMSAFSQTFNPLADAYVRGGSYSSANYGTATTIAIKKGTIADFFRKSYVKFDLTTSGLSEISSAKVRLYASVVSAFSVTAYQGNDSWTEAGITWNNAPLEGAAISTVSVSTVGRYYEWDITAFVQSQLAGDKIVSVVFYDASSSNREIDFNSKEATGNKPELVVVSGSTSTKLNQSISFPALPIKLAGDPDFSSNSTASSGLPVSLASSNTAAATIVNGSIHIVAAGTSVITASQPGDATYNAAPTISQTLTVNPSSGGSGGALVPNDFIPANRFSSVAVKSKIKFADVINYQGSATSLYLDVYQPTGDATKGRPVIIWIHGGGFRTGSSRTQGYIVDYCNRFAKRGYVCMSIDYRLRSSSSMPTQASEFPALQDAARDANAAISWIRANAAIYNIDPTLIFIAGGSAGGRTTQTVCQFDGPDPTALYAPEDQYKTTLWNKSGLVANATLWGGPEPEMRGWLYPSPPYSTANYLQSTDVPTILVHGSADVTILPKNSQDLNNALIAAHVTSELHIIDGATHSCLGYETQISAWIATFFAQEWNKVIVKGNSAALRATKPLALSKTNLADTKKPDFLFYPNPLNPGFLTVKLNDYAIDEQLSVNIYSLQGQQVYTNIFHAGDGTQLNLQPNLPKGVYLISIKSGTTYLTKKLMVK